MKVVLFSLVLGLLVASEGEAQTDNSQFTGRWISHYNAADNVEKITEGGAFHTFMHHIEFDEENGTILFHFYVKENGECIEKYVSGAKEEDFYALDYAGNTEFRLISVDNNALIAHDINVDGNGKKTEVVQLFGSGDSVNSENIEKFNNAVREKGFQKKISGISSIMIPVQRSEEKVTLTLLKSN